MAEVRDDSHYEYWPLDFVLLEMLPDKGLLGGLHWKGRLTRDLAREINNSVEEGPRMTSNGVGKRLRVLKAFGVVEDFPSGQGQRIWARVPEKATALLAKKEDYLS